MKGVKVRLPKKTHWDIRWKFNMFLYGVICLGLGALIAYSVMTMQYVNEIQAQAHRMDGALDVVNQTLKDYTDDRDTIIKSFAEMESRFTRLEHMMRVPRSARRETWRRLEDQDK